MYEQADKLCGLLIGTAVGDSLGLPAEGLSPETIRKLKWTPWKQRLFFGRGMVSDDTDHTFFVAQALLQHPDDPRDFKASLAWKLRWWLVSIPAGIGWGTLRAILKLWLFVPLEKSGVNSAGNGPAMRSAVIGGFFSEKPETIGSYVRCSTELTHRDRRANTGALAISYAAAFAMSHNSDDRPDTHPLFHTLRNAGTGDPEWQRIISLIEQSLNERLSVWEFVGRMKLEKGITGYIYHTVPATLYAWLRHYGDFRTTLTEVLNCGGDTDTVGAISGALAGATVGMSGIPSEWIDSIREWPRSISILRNAGQALAGQEGSPSRPIHYFWPGILIRNVFFLVIVLWHVILRLLPAKTRGRLKI